MVSVGLNKHIGQDVCSSTYQEPVIVVEKGENKGKILNNTVILPQNASRYNDYVDYYP